jgi:antitoxin component of MazEF toxin-antitoxin module
MEIKVSKIGGSLGLRFGKCFNYGPKVLVSVVKGAEATRFVSPTAKFGAFEGVILPKTCALAIGAQYGDTVSVEVSAFSEPVQEGVACTTEKSSADTASDTANTKPQPTPNAPNAT